METEIYRWPGMSLLKLAVIVAVLLGIVSAEPARASVAPLQVKPGRMTSPLLGGALFGGQAGEEFSIIAINENKIRDGVERVIISYGDRSGRPLRGTPGYFHVAVDRDGKRLAIDLAQVSRTAIDQKDLAKILSKSQLISSSDMTMDPQDGSTNITLNLRQSAQVSMTAEADGQGRIVLELRTAKSTAAR
jgi:hypothetical protein